jgi:hypothetical protein
VVPFSSFAEPELQPDGRRQPAWFAFNETRPLALFARIWTHWTSVRRVKEGETTNDLFGFLTTEPNIDFGVIHLKTMPETLTNPEEIDLLTHFTSLPAARRRMRAVPMRGTRADLCRGFLTCFGSSILIRCGATATGVFAGNLPQKDVTPIVWFAPMAVVPGRLAVTRMETFAQVWW